MPARRVAPQFPQTSPSGTRLIRKVGRIVAPPTERSTKTRDGPRVQLTEEVLEGVGVRPQGFSVAHPAWAGEPNVSVPSFGILAAAPHDADCHSPIARGFMGAVHLGMEPAGQRSTSLSQGVVPGLGRNRISAAQVPARQHETKLLRMRGHRRCSILPDHHRGGQRRIHALAGYGDLNEMGKAALILTDAGAVRFVQNQRPTAATGGSAEDSVEFQND